MKTLSLEHIFEKRNSSKSGRIVSHLLFWLVVFGSSFYLIKSSFDPYRDTALSFLSPLRYTLGIALFYYPLMYRLIPQLLKDKNWFRFFIYLSLLILIYVLFEAIGEKVVFEYCDECVAQAEQINPDYLSVIQKGLIDNILFKGSQIGLFLNLFSGVLLPFAIKNSLGYYRAYAQNLQFSKDKVQLELNFLKAQVNPHFLFNTLNNLYGAIIKKRNDQSAEIVTRLSDFMRYSLQNVDRTTIALQEEIELINNYLELEKIRMNHVEVSFVYEVQDGTYEIPPLLFIPLLENAFKYSTDKTGSKIVIRMHEQDQRLSFSIQNNYHADRSLKERGGFGLTNLKKRLDIYYPGKYSLETSKNDSVFHAELTIKLL
ncbi:MAG: histidine kinase [Bacteroidia bacterium]|nr:histidine kinase [Bacteroidia bacterium]